MQNRPVIGLITQIQETVPQPEPLAPAMNQQYLRAIAEARATPQRIPLSCPDAAALRRIYDQLTGLFLTGGADVDPVHYGEARHPLCEPSDPARDDAELLLCRWALEDGKPILGICRGMQLLNVAAGGSLYQDLASQCAAALKHDYFSTAGAYRRDLLVHEVRVARPSSLGRVLDLEGVSVNSMHHQGVRRLAAGLAATAFAPDGMIEAVEATSGAFVIGVQWHPEELIDSSPAMRRLFSAFTAAASRFAEAVTGRPRRAI